MYVSTHATTALMLMNSVWVTITRDVSPQQLPTLPTGYIIDTNNQPLFIAFPSGECQSLPGDPGSQLCNQVKQKSQNRIDLSGNLACSPYSGLGFHG